MFGWDRSNLRKIRARRISREEAEQTLINDAIPIHEQDVEREHRFAYPSETDSQRLLALVVAERGSRISVVTAYDLDAGQKLDYFTRRLQAE